MIEATRRGARSPTLVPAEVRAALASGAPSVNHMEQIAMDMSVLLGCTFPELATQAPRLAPGGLVTRMRTGGAILFERFGPRAWTLASVSGSDTVRGWGAMAIGAAPGIALVERLTLMRPYADDEHFAVREWAWLSLRPHIAADPAAAVKALAPYSRDPSANVRRFASEVCRPRGVWSIHIPQLKRDPDLALPVIEPLFSDEARYVQKSVGNWLNDASHSRPEWVRDVCARIAGQGGKSAAYVCRRALRTLTAG